MCNRIESFFCVYMQWYWEQFYKIGFYAIEWNIFIHIAFLVLYQFCEWRISYNAIHWIWNKYIFFSAKGDKMKLNELQHVSLYLYLHVNWIFIIQ